MPMVNTNPEKMNLSFSGCGFTCIYHCGVAVAIKEYAPHLLKNVISGASAGAILAAALVCDVCISEATSTIIKVVSNARSLTLGPLNPNFNLLALVRVEIERQLPDDAYVRCTGRLRISLTRWSDKENVIVDQFDSNEELIDAIICSCFIPIYCGIIPPKYRGITYVDGGLSNNQPKYDEHTIAVSPFAGENDICPRDEDSASMLLFDFTNTSIRFTSRNLLRVVCCLCPASPEDCVKMCMQGFEDALRFLNRAALTNCMQCLRVQREERERIWSESSCCGSPGCSPMRDAYEEISAAIPGAGCLSTSPSSTNFTKRNSSGYLRNKKRRMESECEQCGGDGESSFKSGDFDFMFPVVMRRTLDEGFNLNKADLGVGGVVSYIASFRIFQVAKSAMSLSKIPYDVLVAFAKHLIKWILNTPAPAWFIKKMNMVLEALHEQLSYQKWRISSIGCVPFILEHKPASVDHDFEEMSPDARQELELLRAHDMRKKKKQQAAKAAAVKSSASGTGQDPDVRLDWCPVSGGDDAMDRVVEYTNNHDAMLAIHYMDSDNRPVNLQLFNCMNPKKKHPCHITNSPRSSGSHDHSHHHSHHSSQSNSAKEKRPVSMVVEEEPDETAASSSSVVFGLNDTPPLDDSMNTGGDEERDSGLSGVENYVAQMSTEVKGSTRDACCSPVRDFPSAELIAGDCCVSYQPLSPVSPVSSPTSTRSQGTSTTPSGHHHVILPSTLRAASNSSSVTRNQKNQQVAARRHTLASSPAVAPTSSQGTTSTHSTHSSRRPLSVPCQALIFSSDSEADIGEKLFIPDRKHRRLSTEYDGEPEPSDTDCAS